MSDVDTLRWGDTDSVTFFTVGSGTLVLVKDTKQLLHAHWERPLTWQLLVVITADLPVTEHGTFIVTLHLTIGVGGGMKQVNIPITITPVAGAFAANITNIPIPAQDVQLFATIDATGNTQETLPETWNLSAFIAPLTEPAGYTDTRNYIAGRPPHLDLDPDNASLPRWMPPGFDDGEVRYRR